MHIHHFRKEWKRNRTLFLMVAPAILLVLFLNYLPMSGLILAFKNYQYNLGIWNSPWAGNNGLENFRFLFISGKGASITFNTVFFTTRST